MDVVEDAVDEVDVDGAIAVDPSLRDPRPDEAGLDAGSSTINSAVRERFGLPCSLFCTSCAPAREVKVRTADKKPESSGCVGC